MIATGYATGYEIAKYAEMASRFFWAAGEGQVYPQLKRLEADGLVTSEPERQGGRRRNRYALTESGESALNEWLVSDATPMWELRDEGLLQLFFSGPLTTAELTHRIQIIRRVHALALERLGEVEATAAEHPAALLTQRHGRLVRSVAVEWCDDILAQLESFDPNAPAADTLREIL